jgi:hypothetical protein
VVVVGIDRPCERAHVLGMHGASDSRKPAKQKPTRKEAPIQCSVFPYQFYCAAFSSGVKHV